MLLSKEDIERLERLGFSREDFTVTAGDGLTMLRNVGERCYFYDPEEKKCQVYEHRPLGCFIYPVIYSNDEGVIVDELCPMGQTISEQELRTKGKILGRLLKKIDNKSARNSTKFMMFYKEDSNAKS
jgi:hypothetical protein